MPDELKEMAIKAARACEGHWSVDFLEDKDGHWWLTDMAPEEVSYKYEVTT